MFLLLYMIGKLTNRYTSSKSGCPKASEACDKKSFRCYIIKYPFVAWFNFLNGAATLVTYALSIVDRFDIFSKVINKELGWFIFACVGTVVMTIMLLIGFRYLIKSKCNSESES